MGVVLKQSLNNTIITYIGFGIGAINTLFLYTYLLSAEFYGLVTVILSAAAVLMPILAFGVPNTLVRFFSSYAESRELNGFLTLMLILPLGLIIPLWVISFFAYDTIGGFLSQENPIVKDYVWYVFLIAFSLAYFEIFYAWAKVHLKSVFGNFMKEVFVRAGTMVLLILLYFKVLTVEAFLIGLVILSLLRTLIMKFYAFRIRRPNLEFKFPENTKSVLIYSSLIILGASVAVVLLEIDKVMINQFLKIENVAYYGVATYIAMVIIVPSRSMHQITYPLTAELMNNNDMKGLKNLYQKSSLTLFIASGLIFILIITNIHQLYELMPAPYRGGFYVVFVVGLIKIYDSVLGNNNSILFNSEYYKSILVLGVILAVSTIGFNLWLIPKFGIEGAAMASFSAFFIYNSLKLVYVKMKFDMLPFTKSSLRVLGIVIFIGVGFYVLNFSIHPLINILLKALLTVGFYIFILHYFKISEDLSAFLRKLIKKQ